jgi:propanol-preferring alcohol dehydrogenase
MQIEGYRIHHWGGDLHWETFTIPSPGPGEALVRVEACGIGLTVLNCIRGDLGNDPAMLPRVPGHELVGRVEVVGEGVTTLTPGQRVMAYF